MRPLPALLLLLLAMVPAGCGEGEKPSGPAAATDEERLIQTILAADDRSTAAEGYRALFRSAKEDDLRRLQRNNSATIAIHAAWEEVELTVPTVPENPEKVVRLDRDKLAWFLGFLERRAQVQIPKWWAEALLDARADGRHHVYTGRPNQAGLPRQATFDKRDGKCVLARVERSPTKTRWVTDVWASCWADGGSGSRARQWIELTEQGDRVVVFGIASCGFHIEAFRVNDGGSVFRFSNAYSR